MLREATTIAAAAATAPVALGWSAWLMAALAGARPAATPDATSNDARIVVLIPAHDEVVALPRAVASLRAGLGSDVFTRIVVVADNCTDHTAGLARELGCEVIERHGEPRGKPAALREALDQLRADAQDFDAVMILDADCEVSPEVAGELAGALGEGALAMQCAYELEGDGDGVAETSKAAFSLKNVVRPRGWSRLGVGSQLFGTGMCFACELLDELDFGDHLVEDALLSWDLLERGVRVRFLPTAHVTSPAAPDRESMTVQRQRWEGGQLRLAAELPRRFRRLLARGDMRGLLAALDWSAPPLTTGLAVWMAGAALAGGAVATGIAHPLALAPAVVGALTLTLYLVVGLAAAGGAMTPVKVAASAPRFLAWKLGVYSGLLDRDTGTWRRTPRVAQVDDAGGTPR